jgi:lysophospholipase L1-like esterase
MKKTNFFYPLALCCGLGTSQVLAQNSKVDLGQISNNNGNFRYVAIGSSLSAGVRDGGVYAAAQQTSFPALLAQQMGINDFKQPLLPGNGTGRKTVAKDKNGILKFTETKGLSDKSANANLPKIVGEVDNLAVPYQKEITSNTNNLYVPYFFSNSPTAKVFSIGNSVIQEQANVVNGTNVVWASELSDTFLSNQRDLDDMTHFNSIGLASMATEYYNHMANIFTKTPILSKVMPFVQFT